MRIDWMAVASVVLVCGCACEPVPYQRAVGRSGEGYSEKRISEDTFYVTYVANACTPDRVLSDYLHRRAAELTLQYGYRYFAVLRTPRRPTHLDIATVGGRTEPEHTIVIEAASRGTLFMPIQCFRDAPESPDMTLIDAKTYLEKKGPQ
ncbi:MAG: hypothetical protein QM570_07375 [Planctomycetota bacterium]|nr:hypothetical protein [Planctomycetota bacterium]